MARVGWSGSISRSTPNVCQLICERSTGLTRTAIGALGGAGEIGALEPASKPGNCSGNSFMGVPLCYERWLEPAGSQRCSGPLSPIGVPHPFPSPAQPPGVPGRSGNTGGFDRPAESLAVWRHKPWMETSAIASYKQDIFSHLLSGGGPSASDMQERRNPAIHCKRFVRWLVN